VRPPLQLVPRCKRVRVGPDAVGACRINGACGADEAGAGRRRMSGLGGGPAALRRIKASADLAGARPGLAPLSGGGAMPTALSSGYGAAAAASSAAAVAAVAAGLRRASAEGPLSVPADGPTASPAAGGRPTSEHSAGAPQPAPAALPGGALRPAAGAGGGPAGGADEPAQAWAPRAHAAAARGSSSGSEAARRAGWRPSRTCPAHVLRQTCMAHDDTYTMMRTSLH